MRNGAAAELSVDQKGQAFGIAELANMFGVTHRTIRFYEDQGLLAPTRVGKTRIFGDRDRVRLEFILRGKRLGFSLADIREWLDLYDVEDGKHRQFRTLLEKSRQRMVELKQQRVDLDESLKELKALEAIAIKGLEKKTDLRADIEHIIRQRPTSGRKGQTR